LPRKEPFKLSKLSLNLESDSNPRLTGLTGMAYRSDRLIGFIQSPLPHQFWLSTRCICMLPLNISKLSQMMLHELLLNCCHPSFSHMSSFRTRSLLGLPQIHRSMHISTTLSCWTCCLLVDLYSASYNIAGRIVLS
jgi:hypothetical protein